MKFPTLRRQAAWAAVLSTICGGMALSGGAAGATAAVKPTALWAAPSADAPLSAVVPADAIFYAGWAGTSAIGERYATSKLRAAVVQMGLPELLGNQVPALIEKNGGPEGVEEYKKVIDLLSVVYDRPGAVFLIPPWDEDTPPSIWGVIDAGDDAGAVAARLAKALPTDEGERAPTLGRDGKLLYIGMPGQKWPGVERPKSLAELPAFQQALGKVRGAGDAVIYGNIQPLIDKGMAIPPIASVLGATGASGVKLAILSARFEQGDWATDAFLSVPGARTGVIETLLSPGGIPADLSGRVPSNAIWMGQATVNVPQLLDRSVQAAATVEPDASQLVQNGLNIAAAATGVQLRTGIIDTLGKEWVFFVEDPKPGAMPGLVALNKPADAALLVKSLDTLANAGKRFILLSGGGGPGGPGGGPGPGANLPTIEIAHDSVSGIDLTHVKVSGPMMPQGIEITWGAKDGLFAIGSGNASVADALAAPPADGGLLATAKFKAIASRLGAPADASMSFVDLSKTWSIYLTAAGMIPPQLYEKVPELEIPAILANLRQVAATLTPAGSASWADAEGFHLRGVTPFPAADLVSPSGITSGAALGTSILLPSLNRARESANRVKCASNMRQIGQAIQLYANENKGKYPPNLATLVKTEDISPEVFTCPSENTPTPKPDEVDTKGDYIYVGQGLDTTATPDIIVLYEKPDAHDKDGMNVLYADGHVEFFSKNGIATAREMSQKALDEWKRAHP
jgi:prepilin-type processing-associated H-X9-DG protein